MKYEVPYIEVIKFEFKNILAAVSDGTGNGGDENTGGFNGPIVDGDEDMSYDPFA